MLPGQIPQLVSQREAFNLHLDHACPVRLTLKYDRVEHIDWLNSSRLCLKKGTNMLL